jgi:hypothetical protein
MKKLLLVMVFASCATFAKDVVYDDVIVSEATSIYDGGTSRVNIKGYPWWVAVR